MSKLEEAKESFTIENVKSRTVSELDAQSNLFRSSWKRNRCA